MATDRDNEELAARFGAMRGAEQGMVPPFDATLAAARRRAPAPVARPAWRRVLVAAALLVAVGGGLWSLRRGAPTAVPEVPIWAWQSPTASLLDVPGGRLIHSMPTLPTAGSADAMHMPQLNGGVR